MYQVSWHLQQVDNGERKGEGYYQTDVLEDLVAVITASIGTIDKTKVVPQFTQVPRAGLGQAGPAHGDAGPARQARLTYIPAARLRSYSSGVNRMMGGAFSRLRSSRFLSMRAAFSRFFLR